MTLTAPGVESDKETPNFSHCLYIANETDFFGLKTLEKELDGEVSYQGPSTHSSLYEHLKLGIYTRQDWALFKVDPNNVDEIEAVKAQHPSSFYQISPANLTLEFGIMGMWNEKRRITATDSQSFDSIDAAFEAYEALSNPRDVILGRLNRNPNRAAIFSGLAGTNKRQFVGRNYRIGYGLEVSVQAKTFLLESNTHTYKLRLSENRNFVI